jgi:hypothetical protein
MLQHVRTLVALLLLLLPSATRTKPLAPVLLAPDQTAIPPGTNTRQVSPPTGHIPITPLALDGLLVTKHGEVRAVAGRWKVLVTIDLPRAPT